MEEKDTHVNDNSPQNVQPEGNQCKCCKKISGDLRIFIISLLTAVIVVLAYHGILMAIRCAKNECRQQRRICPVLMKFCPMQQVPRNTHKGNHHFEMRKNIERCPNCAKREFNSKKFRRDGEHRKFSPESKRNNELKKTEQQK